MVRVASTWVWDVRGETHVKWVTFVLSTWWIHTTNRLLSQLIVRAMHLKRATFQGGCTEIGHKMAYFDAFLPPESSVNEVTFAVLTML
jgi:hypothetical protein